MGKTIVRTERWITAGLVYGLLLSTMLLFGGVGFAQDNGHSGESVVLETIVVTADRIDEYAQAHPQQVVVLGREEIEARNLMDVGEALNTMPGVDVKSSSGVGARISIRGSGVGRGAPDRSRRPLPRLRTR